MKYLIEIHHGIGDVVQMTAILDAIRENDKDAYIAFILNKDAYKTLFDCDERINRFYRIDLVDMSVAEIAKTVIAIRREKFDYFFLSPISNRRASAILTILVGAKYNFGEQLEGLTKISSRYQAVKKEDVHIVKRNENVYKTANIPYSRWCPRLITSNTPKVTVPAKTIAICIGTSIPHKTWDIYIEVAQYYEKKGYAIALLGGVKEAEVYRTYDVPKNDWINLLGKLSLMESAAVTKQCELVLGGDTGVMHMAAAVGAKTLTIFSCTDPR